METATVPDLTASEALARNASRAAKLALLCVIVAIVVLAIDNRIKQAIVTEAEKAGKLYAEVQRLLREASGGRPEPAGEATASPGDSVDSGDGVDDASRASADSDGYAGTGLGATPGRVTRPFGGAPGDE